MTAAPTRMRRLPRLGAALLAVLAVLAAAPAVAQDPTERLLVLDQDAHYVNDTNAGALLNFELAGGLDAAPFVEAAADLGAPFEFLSGLGISPHDGWAYATDLREVPPGRILRMEGSTGVVEVLSDDPRLVRPFSLTFLADGRVVIADLDADPAGLGPDGNGLPGHGALWVLDPTDCDATGCRLDLLSDGTDHGPMPGVGATAFEDPAGVAYDPVRDVLYVADAFADPLGQDYIGAVYSVDPVTGRVETVSSAFEFLALTGMAVRSDGTPLALDALRDDPVVFEIDPANTDPENNFTFLTRGTQYALLEDLAVDETDRLFVVDSGEWNDVTMSFDIPPGLFRVDEANTDPETNGVLVNESVELALPVGLAAVPVPKVASVSPRDISVPTVALVRGHGLSPAVEFDFGPNVTVSDVQLVNPPFFGTDLEMLLTPGGTLPQVPPGCAAGESADLVTLGPFGSTRTLLDVVVLTDATGYTPRAPCSDRGDANCDGLIDGVDLAILGMRFGAGICDIDLFHEDADFTDDGMIDGDDLAILATFFGSRP